MHSSSLVKCVAKYHVIGVKHVKIPFNYRGITSKCATKCFIIFPEYFLLDCFDHFLNFSMGFFFFFLEISPKYLIIESRQMSSLSRCIYNWAHTVPGQVPLRSCEISVSCESSGLTLAIGQGSHVLVSHTALCVTLTEKVKDS